MAEEQALQRPPDEAPLVPQAALAEADAVARRPGRGLEAHPLAGRHPVEVDGEVRVDEGVALEARQYPADAVAEVGRGGDAAERRGRLAGHQRDAQADPVGRRPGPVEAAGDETMLDRVGVEGGPDDPVAPGREGLRTLPGPWRRARTSLGLGRERERDAAETEAERARHLGVARAERGLD